MEDEDLEEEEEEDDGVDENVEDDGVIGNSIFSSAKITLSGAGVGMLLCRDMFFFFS